MNLAAIALDFFNWLNLHLVAACLISFALGAIVLIAFCRSRNSVFWAKVDLTWILIFVPTILMTAFTVGYEARYSKVQDFSDTAWNQLKETALTAAHFRESACISQIEPNEKLEQFCTYTKFLAQQTIRVSDQVATFRPKHLTNNEVNALLLPEVDIESAGPGAVDEIISGLSPEQTTLFSKVWISPQNYNALVFDVGNALTNGFNQYLLFIARNVILLIACCVFPFRLAMPFLKPS
ncbi:hypothetical protein ACFOY8_14760 [Thalassospira xianhensis]|uniref:Uncharacterized protein n=1 Tax=Thalassospira xianhensis MCCC 1A02616 TaxID=1177929 RepID=A0A367UHE9_9PROT|nr:hypothetical protein [Thalassospira xianhensis]RCK07589.1 hypothetical protein TH5_00470 [Thalassospira xianhensis MCCC 1A02616]